MNLVEIQITIAKYQELEKLARQKIAIMEKHDYRAYGTARGIERISFDDELVYVVCDDTCLGHYDTLSFEFPVSLLALGDEELEVEINRRREERERKEIEDAEARKRKDLDLQKQRDLETLRKLKEKYPGL